MPTRRLACFIYSLCLQGGERGKLSQLIEAYRAIRLLHQRFVHEVLELGEMHELGHYGSCTVLFLKVDEGNLYAEEDCAEEDLEVVGFELEYVGRKCTHVVHDYVAWDGKQQIGVELILQPVPNNKIVIHLRPHNHHRTEQKHILQITHIRNHTP